MLNFGEPSPIRCLRFVVCSLYFVMCSVNPAAVTNFLLRNPAAVTNFLLRNPAAVTNFKMDMHAPLEGIWSGRLWKGKFVTACGGVGPINGQLPYIYIYIERERERENKFIFNRNREFVGPSI